MSAPTAPTAPPPPTSQPHPSTVAQPRPTIADLFLAFAAMSLSGFGGVLAWARRIMVEKRRWFTAEQFNEAFALCAFLPGGNMVNFG
jgi:chromate transporter